VGKASFVRLSGGEFDRVVLRLDLDACKESLVGESLHPDEEIYVCRRKGGFDFERMPISVFHERFKAGDQDWYTWTYSDTCGAEIGKVTNSFQHVRRERFLRVTTRSGRSVIVTEGHSLFTRRKMVNPAAVNMELAEATTEQRQEAGRAVGHYTDEPVLIPAVAKDLRVGDRIAVARNLHNCKNSTHSVQFGECELHPTEEIAEWFGIWIADGSFTKGAARACLAYDDQEVIDRLMSNFGSDAFSVYSKDGIRAWDVFVREGHWLNTAMRIAEMEGKSRTKRIPAWLFGCSSSVIGAFLRGYFSGDGSISGHVIEASTMSKRLAEDVMLALARLGIFARMRKRYCKSKTLSIARPDYLTPGGWQYRVCISKASEVRRFATKVGFIQSYKQEAVMKLLSSRKDRKYLAGRIFHAVIWDEVASIEEVDGPGFSYDISVEGTEKFVAGGIIVHNSEAKLRAATSVIKACADEPGSMFWIATANSIESLSGPMKNRFVDTFHLSLPNREERLRIWDVWLKKLELDDAPYENDEGWNGRNVAQCCEKAWRMSIPVAQAARWITAVGITDAEGIANLDKQADGRYLSATQPGLYRRPKQSSGGRRVEL
jgi:intein/homing endonuclease